MNGGIRLGGQKGEECHQMILGIILVVGLVLVVFSGFGTYMFAAGSVHHATATRNPSTGAVTSMGDGVYTLVAFGGVIVGALMILGALLWGLWHATNETRGSRQALPMVRVVARYVLAPSGTLHTDPNEIEMIERPKYYVRLAIPHHGSLEFSTSPETFWYCGEGMTGDAEVQGKWLGQFTPHVQSSIINPLI